MSDQEYPLHDPIEEEPLPEESSPSAESAAVLKILKSALPLGIIALSVVILVVLGKKEEAGERPPQPPARLEVEVEPAIPHDGTLTLDIYGQVVPYREIQISSELAGKITYKSPRCQAGCYVREGQPLLRIDPRDYEIAWNRLKAQKKQAEVNIAELNAQVGNTQSLVSLAKRELDLQQNEVRRLEQLVKTGVITKSQIDAERRNEVKAINAMTTLNNELHVLNTRRAGLTSALEQISLELDQTRLNYERTMINSPCNGVIVSDPVEQGSYVNKGTELVVVEDTAAAEVKCNLRMDQLLWIWNQPELAQNKSVTQPSLDKLGPVAESLPIDSHTPRDGEGRTTQPTTSPVTPPTENKYDRVLEYEIPLTRVDVIYQQNGREYVWPGELKRFDGIGLDGATRTVPCRVVVSNPLDVTARSGVAAGEKGPPALVRNMFVTIEIKVRVNPDLSIFSIPEIALQPAGGLWRVRNGLLTQISAEAIGTHGKNVFVNVKPGDLKAGDKVVVSPVNGVDPTAETAITEKVHQ